MPEANSYLNLGCGNRYHPAWINIDIAPQGPEVIQNDLCRGIPLSDASCDVVYHAAVLEHLRRPDAEAFLADCYRVLKPGGIIRIGVPDLEKICQLYLSRLDAALDGEEATSHDYDWIMLELFDQVVREKSGGGMLDYLRQNPLPNETFVYERIGEEGRELVRALRLQYGQGRNTLGVFLSRLGKGLRTLPCFLQELRRTLRYSKRAVKSLILRGLLGAADRRALEIGRFRLAGEVHQWMYDRYSLARLLSLTGFNEPRLQDASTSLIPNWADFHLDTLPDGQVIKPDLIFMEAIKPGEPLHG